MQDAFSLKKKNELELYWNCCPWEINGSSPEQCSREQGGSRAGLSA